ncbi:MAG: NAD(P)-dependent oxidoreductase [Ignavibacteria bacterium]|nr:NAD(P)-dependent oxidoreductase [Ignavibacteria bacterium]
MRERVGFVGLGLMGFAMAERLLGAGYRLSVYNRTSEKITPLERTGAVRCATPSSVASRSDIVLSMLSTSEVLEDLSLSDGGILAGCRESSIHVDFSTVSPALTQRLQERYVAKNCHFVHCPVLGSVPQARDGKLLLFAGGKAEILQRISPLLATLGEEIWMFDRPELASHTKLLCNSFIAGMITTLAQALVYSGRAGVNPEILLEILSHSALNAPMYQTKGKSIIDGNFSPRFFLEHMLKDSHLILDSAEELQVPMPGIVAARGIYEKAEQQGFGRADYSSVVKILKQ